MNVTVIEKRSGQSKTLPKRYADLLVKLGKHVYAGGQVSKDEPVPVLVQAEQTFPVKRGPGRPPKAKSA